jgi:hypothetical protein
MALTKWMSISLKQRLLFLVSLLIATQAFAQTEATKDARQKRLQKAEALFKERCKTAGEFIKRTVDNVEGIYLMKLRPSKINYGDQFVLDDPYGRDLGGEGYFHAFLRGSDMRTTPTRPGDPLRLGYHYVEADDPKDGKRYWYTGARKAVGQMDKTAPNVQSLLKSNPNADIKIYAFVLDKAPAPRTPPRYGVTYDDISTREDRELWIAGSSLKVIDLKTNEVIAERIGYMMDKGQGNNSGGRSPWLLAADNACPDFHRFPNPLVRVPGASAQARQTQDFVEKVLHPIQGK